MTHGIQGRAWEGGGIRLVVSAPMRLESRGPRQSRGPRESFAGMPRLGGDSAEGPEGVR
jgi:hypothetical protein